MKSLVSKIVGIAKSVWKFVKTIVVLSTGFVLDILFSLIDLVCPLVELAYFVKTRLPRFWKWAISLGWIKRARLSKRGAERA